MVGKYTNLSDAYLSVIKSLQHACLAANRRLNILWIEASDLVEECRDTNSKAHTVSPLSLVSDLYQPRMSDGIGLAGSLLQLLNL